MNTICRSRGVVITDNIMKKITGFFIFVYLFAGCVGQKRLDIPLTETEKVFFAQIINEVSYRIDSITRLVTKDLRESSGVIDIFTGNRWEPTIYFKVWLNIPDPEDSVFQKVQKADADKMAKFASRLSLDGMELKGCHVTFRYTNGGEFFDYSIQNGIIRRKYYKIGKGWCYESIDE